jgi:phosphoribosylanthranilate isomerase
MPLKTLVKAGNITNLSDARYCSGMGVDMLGFGVVPGEPNHLPETLYQQIRGWVSGPKVVAECYGAKVGFDLKTALSNYAPDYIECSFLEFDFLKSQTDLPFILYVSAKELNRISETDPRIAYWIIEHNDKVSTGSIPVLVKVNSRGDLNFASDYAGVVVSGSPELRPGFKNYDELSEILEALEE